MLSEANATQKLKPVCLNPYNFMVKVPDQSISLSNKIVLKNNQCFL